MAKYNPYNITFLYGFMKPNSGASFSFNADIEGKFVLTKEQFFTEAFSDRTTVLVSGGNPKAKCDADRTYLHYIIDCWLDDKPVELQPGDLL